MIRSATKIRAGLAAALLLSSNASPGAVIPFSPLPIGGMTKIPDRTPSHVGGAEHVSGLFVAVAPLSSGAPQYKRIQILDSRRDATTFAQKGYVPVTPGAPFGTKQCVFTTDESSAPGDAWPVLARGEISSFSGSNQKPVVGVHVESLEGGPSSEKNALDIVDAWLDTRTRGLRLIQRAVVPLESVAEGPFGIRVLAAKSEDAVSFVVLPPVAGTDSTAFGGQFDRGIVESGGEAGVSQCRHNRLTLQALPGSGEHAVVTFQHVEQAPREAADGKPDDAKAGRSDAFAKSRTRLVQVHLSVSRNRASSEPIVSVSFRLDKPKPFGT